MEAFIVKGVRVVAMGMDSDLRMVLPLTRPLWFWRVIADSGCSAAAAIFLNILAQAPETIQPDIDHQPQGRSKALIMLLSSSSRPPVMAG